MSNRDPANDVTVHLSQEEGARNPIGCDFESKAVPVDASYVGRPRFSRLLEDELEVLGSELGLCLGDLPLVPQCGWSQEHLGPAGSIHPHILPRIART